jgi:uncharacterized protein (DUF1697 family)
VSRTFAFLRAINVGGHVVTMAALRGQFEALGLTDVETFIASGNVIFTTPARIPTMLPRRIEAHLHRALGYEVHTFLRSQTEVTAIASHRPFPPSEIEAAGAFSVGLLAEPLTASKRKAALALRTDIDDFQGRATFRSMTTMTRLLARYATP